MTTDSFQQPAEENAVFHVRQGDILVSRIEDLPADLIAREREGGAHVLAHGEATGHRHAIYDEGAELLEPAPSSDPVERRDGNVLYLRVTKPVALRHEEHAAIGLAPGNYRVTRQREYSPEEIRTVAD